MGPSVPLVTMTPVNHAIELGATPMAVDEQGVPRLLRGSDAMPSLVAADASSSARQHVERLAPAWNVGANAVPTLDSLGEVPMPGGTIVRLGQSIDGIPISAADGGELRVMVRKDGSLVAASGKLIAATTPHAKAVAFQQDDASAVAHAVSDVYNVKFPSSTLAMASLAAGGTRFLSGQSGQVNVSLSRARKTWFPEGKVLTAAWVVEAYTSDMKSTSGEAFRRVIADADGRVLSRTNLTAEAVFKYRVFAETTGELHPFDGPIVDVTPHPTGIPNTVPYPAFVLPNLISVDGLNHPAGQAGPDPWLPAGKTETLGNNIEAYTDINPPDGLTFGDFRATITAPGEFDRTYDTSITALSGQAQQMAAIAQLFYTFNWLHDFWYDAGFTEAAGNAQNVNFGRGGEDRDAMNVEAQDNANNGSRNNANMSTPQDGFPPRMQVFVWTGAEDRTLAIKDRTPASGPAAFGTTNVTVTADMVLANDGNTTGGSTTSDACTALVAPATGKIVLADRGTCSFKTKALNAQNAGAVGLIIANNAPGASPPSLGDDATITTAITIVVVSILQPEGVQTKADLLAGPVTATIHRGVLGPELDGSLDATVMAHENGHYVHHRLTSCNTTLCGAMSEGWGDFQALLLEARAGDNFNGAFAAAVYSTKSFPADPVYYGIRRAPYSTNQAINALSFRHMAAGAVLPPLPFNGGGNNNEVHNAGEVWASMMWEGYAALQSQPGADFNAVRLKMRQYVVGGLLLAPTDATPTETRDSILLFARASSPADHDVLAAAYARRGFGSCAISPDRNSTTFVGIVESNEVKGNLVAGAPSIQVTSSCDGDDVLDGGETARITVPLSNTGPAALASVSVTLSSTTPGVHILAPTVAIGAVAAYGASSATFDISLDNTATTVLSGDFNLQLASSNGCTAALAVPFSTRLNTDDVANSSANDTFDAAASVWVPTGAGAFSHNRRSALDGFWFGADLGEPSDSSLTSPAVTAGTGPVIITFQHRFSFEGTVATAFDGGVVEYSTDGGVTFQDISALANPGYNVTLTGTPGTTGNPLAGRLAYGATNAAFPATEVVTLNLGTALAGQTFRIRFRAGSDTNTGAPGWEIDNLTFAGIVGTPFPTQVPDTGTCNTGPDAGVPPIDAPPPPPGCSVSITGPATGSFGQPVHLTATAVCNPGTAEVQFLKKVNSATVVIQPFSTALTTDFTADAVGTISFFAQARTQGTTRVQATSNTVAVKVSDNAPICTSVRMTSPPNGATLHVGAAQSLTASAVCPAGAVPEFQFWVKLVGAANWTILPGFTTGAGSFTPTATGSFAIRAVARSVGAQVAYQVASTAVAVTVAP
jgi:Fungalysin metallopeptidase (M36)/PA domain